MKTTRPTIERSLLREEGEKGRRLAVAAALLKAARKHKGVLTAMAEELRISPNNVWLFARSAGIEAELRAEVDRLRR